VKIILFANTDWYLYNFRSPLALALRDAGHDVLLISPAGAYGEKLRQLGLRWQALPMDRRSLNPFREALLLLHLVRLCRREQADLIHSFTIKCAVYGSLVARFARVPMRVNAVAGLGYVFTNTGLKARILRPLLRGLMRFALDGKRARLILQNPDDLAFFKRARIVSHERIRVIPGSGVDCARFAPVPREYDSSSPCRVLLAARLLWDKGIAEFVEAARQLRAQGLALRFLLAGTSDFGNPAAVQESAIKTWIDEGVVEWLGHVDNMPTLLNSVDVAVLPSYREGLPKSLIEAAACALPLIATDAPGCREVVEHEVDGLLVPVGDAPALANAIERLYKDIPLRKTLGARARAKVLDRFEGGIIVANTMAVYREMA
jgi:glycosyltransferase involved in cell wall biosynthesis